MGFVLYKIAGSTLFIIMSIPQTNIASSSGFEPRPPSFQYQETRQRLDTKYLKKNFYEAARGYRVYIRQYTGSEFFS